MIARSKMSQIEWNAVEIPTSKVGNVSPFSCLGLVLITLTQCGPGSHPLLPVRSIELRKPFFVLGAIAEFLCGTFAHDFFKKGPGNCILTSHATSAELEELKKASSPFPKSCDVAKQVVVWALNRSGRQESAAAVA